MSAPITDSPVLTVIVDKIWNELAENIINEIARVNIIDVF